jgi:predicted secreted acid phosphatase
MSRLRIVLIAALVALLVPAVVAVAKEPAAPASPADVRAYHDSGEWAKDTKAAFATATKDLKKALAKKKAKGKPTLILDIDDTTLSTYDCIEPDDFSSIASARCIVAAKLPVIPEAKALAKAAQKQKVKLVFITARPEGIRTQTIANLKLAGLTKYTLIMKPNDAGAQTAAQYKTAARAQLEKDGARIVLSVGDQKSDLSGGHAAYTVKVPNPMYVNK